MFRLLLVIAIGAISNLVAADLSGKWTLTMETNGSRVPVYLTLNQHGQELSGTVAAGDDVKPVPIENPAIHGDELTFDIHDNANRMVTFRLTLTNFVLTGEASAGGQVSKVSTPAKGAVFRVGGVLLYVEIDPNGHGTTIWVRHSLGLGLDEKAIEAVRQWKFKP